jgi:shikimate kinase
MDRTGELPPFLNTENPRETHRQLHERRGKIYRERAAITVRAGNTPEETAAAMLRRLKETLLRDREAGLPGGWPE